MTERDLMAGIPLENNGSNGSRGRLKMLGVGGGLTERDLLAGIMVMARARRWLASVSSVYLHQRDRERTADAFS